MAAAAWLIVVAPSQSSAHDTSVLSVAATTTGRIALGEAHTCAIQTDGALMCWGDNQYQQFARPAGDSNTYTTTPVSAGALGGGRVAVQLAAGARHTCALARDGTVWCWGDNGAGQLGIGTLSSSVNATQVTLTTAAASISAGGQNTCAILDDGTLYCWGSNDSNQLAMSSSTTSSATPVKIDIPVGVVLSDVAVGRSHVCALATTGSMYCWGNYGNGRLGSGVLSNLASPTATVSYTLPTDVAAGMAHTCVRVSSGEVTCVGDNSSNQFGAPLTSGTSTPTPTQVVGSGALAVTAGDDHTCLMFDTSVKCAGLGFTDLATIGGISGTVADVVAGANHTCAVMSTGEVRCWGTNNKGQLGIGNRINQAAASAVGSLSVATSTTSPTPSSTIAATSTTSALSPTTTSVLSSSTTTSVLAPTTTAPSTAKPKYLTVRKGRTLSAVKVASFAKLTIPIASKGSMRISITLGTKYCAFKGSSIKGMKKGQCRVRILLIPKKGKIISRTVTIRVA